MGGQIVSGTGKIGSANAQALTVTQSSPKMIVDWASFNVGAGSTVTFVQPGSSSVALNRVTGPDPSTIQGSIRANGQVFLVNPNGVYFTPGSQISVGALVASTLKISNEDFNSGRYRFEGNSTAQLINEGSITATGDGTNSGAAYFIAARVINRGSIDAPHGKVGLASGRKVMLDIGAPVPLQIDESAIDGLIEQSGIIKADGGQIMITSKAASALHASVINQTGTLQATSLGIGQNGEIILSAGENGTANISGTLNVSSPDNQAGRVEVTAQKITIKDGARIDATGQTGGGTVLIGGDWQGSGATQQAKTVSVEPDVEIDASAKSLGDGGKVVVWSDIRDPESITAVSGSLKSEGGSIQGNGGMIETSGHALQVDGIRISSQAPNGKTGLWLLDPYNIEISSSPGSTTITPATSGSPANTAYTAGGDTSVVFVGDLHDALANNNVTVFTGNSGLQNGDITVSSPISLASGNLLTLEAARNVVLNGTVTLTGGSDLSITADGGLSGASGVSLASGSALIVEQAGTSTYSGVISGAGALTKLGSGTLTLTGANNYSGTSTITAGTLSIGNGGTTGSLASTTINNNGLLTFNRLDDLTYSGVISGTGSLSKLGAGVLYLTGTNSYSGTSTITEGTLSIGNGGASGSVNSAAINNSGTLIFNRTNDSTYGGTISGTGTLTKLGTGTLHLTGENDYSGVSTITAGTLSIGDGGTTGSISNSSISNSGSLHFNRSNNSTYTGVISGTGTLTKLGAGTLYLTGANTYSGTSSITAGTLSLGDGGSTGSIASTTISNNGSLEFNRSNDLTYSGVISGTGSLSKRGTGALTLSGANTFDGATTISEGTLITSHNSALGSATGGTTIQSGATLQISNGTTISTENLTLNGSGVSASSGALLLSNTGNYSSSLITLASDSKILINGTSTDPAVALSAISGSSSSLTVDIPSGRQVSQSAAANLDKLAFTGSSGVVNFSNAGNTVSTIAADTGTLTYVNSTILTIGTVNPSGITATGPVSITTTSGDLTVSAPISASNTISLSTNSGDLIVGAAISTSNTSATAIVLNAGTASAAGTETGGDIQVASSVTIGSSGGGRTTFYTGSVAGSSGVNNVVSYGSGNFRYNADEASVAPAGIAAGTSGTYAIYREQPTISVQADDKTKIFDYIAFPAAQLTSTCTGCANGDLPVITYTGTAGNGNAVYIRDYPITATYDATYLGTVGYRVVGSSVTPGTLSIVPFPGYIPPPRETVERTSQIPIRHLIENIQPTKLKTVLADHPSLVSLFSPTTAKGNIRLAYQDGTAYRADIRLREGIVRDTIFFDAGKPSLTNEATRTLDSLLRTANRYNLSAVEVVGHTELPNSPEDALKLSEERAIVVSEYLQNRWSLDKRPAKITSLGRSYLQPISDNITYSGRARNRRTEVTITGISLE